MNFRKTWFPVITDDGTILDYEPAFNVSLFNQDRRLIRWRFLVDVGVELSMAPREFCERLGIPWEDGIPMVLSGISPREECQVMGRVHDVEIFIPEIDRSLVIPICFAAGDTVSLLGRRRFFDAFRIQFDQPYRTTTFEFLLEP